jgi:hypothetical protein
MEQHNQYWKVFWVINSSMEQYKIRRATQSEITQVVNSAIE